jgi:hypothetical protein
MQTITHLSNNILLKFQNHSHFKVMEGMSTFLLPHCFGIKIKKFKFSHTLNKVLVKGQLFFQHPMTFLLSLLVLQYIHKSIALVFIKICTAGILESSSISSPTYPPHPSLHEQTSHTRSFIQLFLESWILFLPVPLPWPLPTTLMPWLLLSSLL